MPLPGEVEPGDIQPYTRASSSQMVMRVERLGMAGTNAAAKETWVFSKTETITAMRQESHVWVSTQKPENRVLKTLLTAALLTTVLGQSQTAEAIQKPAAKASKQKCADTRQPTIQPSNSM